MSKFLEYILNTILGLVKFIPDKILTNKYFHLAYLLFGIVFLVIFGVFYYYLA